MSKLNIAKHPMILYILTTALFLGIIIQKQADYIKIEQQRNRPNNVDYTHLVAYIYIIQSNANIEHNTSPLLFQPFI